MKEVLLILSLILLVSCSGDEFPAYDVIENTIPEGGSTIIYDKSLGLTNIRELEHQLSKQNEIVFSKSIAWYGTESEFNLDRLHNKTAHELVEMVNCLKSTPADPEREKCFR